jgi:hypothetical protein
VEQAGVDRGTPRWEWKDLGAQIGGPNMIQLPDKRFVAAVRVYGQQVRTALCWLDPQAGKLTEFLTLPSGGDTSYGGGGLQSAGRVCQRAR